MNVVSKAFTVKVHSLARIYIRTFKKTPVALEINIAKVVLLFHTKLIITPGVN